MEKHSADVATLVILDAPNLIHRAYHAVQAGVLAGAKELTAPDGRPTGALTGYCNMALRARGLFPQAAFAAAWESKGSFRKELYPEYKANRPPTPETLREQIRMAARMTELMGIPSLACEGFEADDMLCAVAARASRMGWRVILATGDKDMGQAVCESVELWKPESKTAQTLGESYVLEKFGVRPELVAEWLALVGDTSDNIPGVDKIGPKTAAELLNRHGSVEGILGSLSEMSPARRAHFERAKETLPISLVLAKARLDAPLPVEIAEIPIRNRDADWAEAIRMAKEMGMGALAGKLEREAAAPRKEPASPAPAPEPEKPGSQLRLF